MTLLRALIVLASAALSVGGNGPYVRGIRLRLPDHRPRLISWCIWAQTMWVGTIQEFRAVTIPWSAGGLAIMSASAAGVYTGACAIGCCAVLWTGWRFGDGHKADALDWTCLALAQAGVLLLALSIPWPGTVPPWTAVAVAVLTDFLAFIPTYRGGLQGTEPWLPYAMFAAGSALALTVASYATPTEYLYTIYLVLGDGAMAALVLAVRFRAEPEPAFAELPTMPMMVMHVDPAGPALRELPAPRELAVPAARWAWPSPFPAARWSWPEPAQPPAPLQVLPEGNGHVAEIARRRAAATHCADPGCMVCAPLLPFRHACTEPSCLVCPNQAAAGSGSAPSPAR